MISMGFGNCESVSMLVHGSVNTDWKGWSPWM